MNVSVVFALEQTGWPAMLVNPEGLILRSNSAAQETLGSAAKSGENFVEMWEVTAALKELLSGGKPAFTLVKRKGKPSQFALAVMPLSTGLSQEILVQIFELPKNEPQSSPPPQPQASTAVEANVAQKQKLDCAMQLARTVSLDFNNALTSILGHASLLLSKADQEHPWRNSLVEIEKSAERAAEISNDLANFSRHEKEASAQKAGNINEVVRQTVEAFRKPENARIEFQLNLERRLLAAKFDEAKVQQAIARVIENSIQAISGNGIVTVSTENLENPPENLRLGPGSYVCVRVTDTGCGIPADVLPRVFDPFFTTKGSNHRGLGLAWVYGVVTHHRGAVHVSSEQGRGTAVELYFPASKKVVRESSGLPDELCGVETVLVVDDEELLLNMSQMVLSSFGYRALTANNGQKALEILASEVVDLVITDLVMPGMSGRELVDRVRLLVPDVRVVCSSGYVRPANHAEEFYLQKPFTAQELLSKVRQALSTEAKT